MSGQIFQGNHLIAETNDAPLGFEQGGIEVTQAQYDQLVADDNVAEDTNYYITDTKVIMRNNIRYAGAVNEIIPKNAGARNSMYRGKSLGSAVTTEQYDAIDNGTFDDLFIGDYWTIDGIDYVIADFDYWLGTGDTECTTHHVVIVPKTVMYNAKMNSSSITTGGYAGSEMRTTNLTTAKTTIQTAFGSVHILSHRELLVKTVTDGKASEWGLYDSDVELMSEYMIYGSNVWASSPGYETGLDKSQLSLFRVMPSLLITRSWYWLRNVASVSSFTGISDGGNPAHYDASGIGGVRPVFAICKANS